MKKYYTLIFVIIFSSISYSQWFLQKQLPGNINLHCVKFLNSNTGWIVGSDGAIFKTTDQGNNWTLQLSNSLNTLNSLSIIDSNNVFAVGDSGTILKTTDSGQNWINIKSNIKNYEGKNNLSSISFPSKMIGYATGDVTLKTTDGGKDWNNISGGLPGSNLSVYFVSDSIGWVTMDILGEIFNTSDGGKTWSVQYSTEDFHSFDYYQSIFFITDSIGFAAGGHYPGGGSIILKTTDQGLNWSYQSPDWFGEQVNSIYFITPNKGWAVTSAPEDSVHTIMHTIDGGLTWISDSVDIHCSLNSVYFTDSLTGWAVGNNGIILKTITGGVTSIKGNFSYRHPDRYSLSQNYPNPFNPITTINYLVSKNKFNYHKSL